MVPIVRFQNCLCVGLLAWLAADSRLCWSLASATRRATSRFLYWKTWNCDPLLSPLGVACVKNCSATYSQLVLTPPSTETSVSITWHSSIFPFFPQLFFNVLVILHLALVFDRRSLNLKSIEATTDINFIFKYDRINSWNITIINWISI